MYRSLKNQHEASMKVSPAPANEKERLAATRRYRILDTEDEQDFDDIVHLAAQICNTSMAIITLLDEDRQWFKARKGLKLKETPRNLSFCAHAIHEDDIFIVEDTLQDNRFADNPLVTGEPNIRFYTGAPLTTPDGYKLGTLSVLDNKPRKLSEEQLDSLRKLGRQVVNLLNLRYNILLLQESNKKIEQLERIKAEKSVRHAEEKYLKIFQNSLEGIFQATPEWQLMTVNPSLAKMFGYTSPDEMIAAIENFSQVLYPDDKERSHMIDQLETEGLAGNIETKIKKKNNKAVWIRAGIRTVKNDEEDILYYEGSLEDITDRKLSEEKLKAQFEELQKANHELDRFVYSVSHDLRAPLTSLLGLINIAELEELSPSHQQYLQMMRSCISRLDYFIKDILNYSQNSRVDILNERVNFYKLVNETKETLQKMPGAEMLTINVEIQDDVPFYSDSNRIRVLLHNLLSNAIKYQDPNKKFSLVFLRIETSDKKVSIITKDNGIGIEKAHLAKIFNLFYRASHHSKGSGLGLYITRETVTKLHGKIKVDSELGKFTTFEIEIPNMRPISSGKSRKTDKSRHKQ